MSPRKAISRPRAPRARARSPWLLAVLLLVATTLACRGTDAPAGKGAPTAALEPRRGGTLVIGMSADMVGVNPYLSFLSAVSQEICTQLFVRLLEEQPDFAEHPPTLTPRLAERWEVSDDKKTITFFLRQDVRWSDGQPVTAEDVRFTWQAQTSPEVGWDNAFYKESIRDVEVVDPHTVRFHLKSVAANELLWINEGEIIPKHVWGELPFAKWRESTDWFREHLVVAGPFTLSSWSPQQEIVLSRNDSYFEAGKPYLDRVIIRVIPDQASLVNQLLAGDIDYLTGLSVKDAERVTQAKNVVLGSHWSRAQVFLAWNVRKPLFADPALRRALTQAIDRQAIVDVTYGRYGKIANGPLLSTIWAFDRDLETLPYDPDAARRLLAEQGWSDHDGDGVLDRKGKRLAFTLETNTGNQQRNDAAVLIQNQLRQIGVAVEVRLSAFNTLMERATHGDFDAVIMRWAMPTDLDMTFGYHTKLIGDSNVFGYSNPEVDRLLEEAQKVPTYEELGTRLLTIQQKIQHDQPSTGLYESQDLWALNRRVHGASPNVLRRFWHLWEWWVDPAPQG